MRPFVLFLLVSLVFISSCTSSSPVIEDRQPTPTIELVNNQDEEVIEDELPVVEMNFDKIDTHMHLNALLPGDLTSPTTDYEGAVTELLTLMDTMGVDKAILVVVPSHVLDRLEEEENMISSAAISERLDVLAGGSLLGEMLQTISSGAVTEGHQLEFSTKAIGLLDSGAIGFGEMITLHLCLGPTHSFQYAPPDHPLYLLLADIAAIREVPIDLHMEAVEEERPMPDNLRNACEHNPDTLPATIPALETLLAHNRQANIVWQHIGFDNTGEMTVILLRRLLEDHSNLYLALKVEERLVQVGRGGTMPNRILDSSWNLTDEWLGLISEFPDRFVIGADEFVSPSNGTGIGGQSQSPQSFEETWPIVNQLPAEIAFMVASENAARIYGIK